MSRKNRRSRRGLGPAPSKRVNNPVINNVVPYTFVPASLTPPPFYPEFTPHASRVAQSLGMSRRQLVDLLECGDEEYASQVIEKASQPCGECQLCCELLSIKTFDSPTYQKCPKQCATGCSIHGHHPEECRVYACFWKMRWINEGLEYRPDNLGAIFDFDNTTHGPVLRVWQTEPEMVLNHPEVRRITIELANQYAVPVFTYYKDDCKSVFLVPALSRWRPAFEKRFPEYPVFDLPGLESPS